MKNRYSKIRMFFQECPVSFCPLCRLDRKVRKIRIRGLCSKSIFNSDYIMTMAPEGNVRYMGQYTSSILYNKANKQWEWYDQKDNSSIATR